MAYNTLVLVLKCEGSLALFSMDVCTLRKIPIYKLVTCKMYTYKYTVVFRCTCTIFRLFLWQLPCEAVGSKTTTISSRDNGTGVAQQQYVY